MIKTLLFDNNGVLTLSDKEKTISSFAAYFKIVEEDLAKVFDDFAKPLDDGTITTLEFHQRLANHFEKKFDKDELKKVHINSYQVKPEMREKLEELKQKYEIALLTNFGDAFDEANEKVWKYQGLFEEDRLFVSAKLKMKKPDQNIYQFAIEKLDKKPEEIVFIDDREANLVPAQKLGMKTILFISKEQFEKDLDKLLRQEKVNVG